jgi:transcriptional regulator with XRE-family HTH domain
MNFEDILNRAVEASGAASDSDLSRKLGVSRQAVSNWRGGKKFPDTVTCATIAGITGIPLAQVLGVVGEARAISREEKAVWRKLAATAMALALGVGFASTRDVQAAVGHSASDSVYIMRNDVSVHLAVRKLRLALAQAPVGSCFPSRTPNKDQIAGGVVRRGAAQHPHVIPHGSAASYRKVQIPEPNR